MWPSTEAVAKRGSNLYADYKQGLDIQKYATTGQEDKRMALTKGKRNNSPGKSTGGSKGGNWKTQGATDEAQHQTISSEVASSKPKAPQPDVMCGSHLKTADDLTGFPTFPNGTKSLLKKHLSREIWAKYAD